MTGERGVSSVVSTVLMVGIVVLIAIPAGIYALQVADPGSDPSPNVKRADASMTQGASVENQSISIAHGGGDTIDMENVEIVVRLADAGESARIVGLPVSSNTLSSSNVEGDSVVNTSYDVSETVLSTANGDGEWTVEESVSFGINSTSLAADQTVVVTLVHTETDSVLGEERFNTSA